MRKKLDETTDMGRLFIAASAKYPHIKTFADIAHHLDVLEQVLSNWKRRGIPAGKIFDLSEEFGCNPKWLATGKVDMKDDEKNPYGIDLSRITLEKANHVKEITEMTDEEFRSQESVFEAVVKSATNRKRQE